ncbi:MAG: hypothetical protein R6W76_22845 [Caldilinea sp.]
MLSIRNTFQSFRVAIIVAAVFAIMAGLTVSRVSAQDAITQDLTTLSDADISAYRWQATARFYAGQPAATDLTTLNVANVSISR